MLQHSVRGGGAYANFFNKMVKKSCINYNNFFFNKIWIIGKYMFIHFFKKFIVNNNYFNIYLIIYMTIKNKK